MRLGLGGLSLMPATFGMALARSPEPLCLVQPRLARYQGSHLIEDLTLPVVRDHNHFERWFGAAHWACFIRQDKAKGITDALDVGLDFNVLDGEAAAQTVGFSLAFPQWSAENYVLAPSALYDGNRFISRPLSWPPMIPEADAGLHPPIIISDVPRLNIDGGPSKASFLAGDMATPAVGVFDPGRRRGMWLLLPQRSSLGDYSIAVSESERRDRAWIIVTAPGVREDHRYKMTTTADPSPDRGAFFARGQEASLRFRLHAFACRDVQTLYDRFLDIRHDLAEPVSRPNLLPLSAASGLIFGALNRDTWVEEPGYYGKA